MREILEKFGGKVVAVDVAKAKRNIIGGRYQVGVDDCWYLCIKPESGVTAEELHESLGRLHTDRESEFNRTARLRLVNRPEEIHRNAFLPREFSEFGKRGKMVLVTLKHASDDDFVRAWISKLEQG